MQAIKVAGLIALNLGSLVLSSAGFKWSADSSDWRGFLLGQIVGNGAGFIAVLALTGMIREISSYRAYAIHFGLGFVLAEVLLAGLFFHEHLGWPQFVGILLVFGGVLMITLWR